MPAINSLGIGSGVLTADVIDKLKESERASTVTPIEDKITKANSKADSLDLVESLLTSFKSSAAALKNDGLYLEREVKGNNSGIEVIAEAGVSVQDFTLEVSKLAQKNIQQSGTFSTKGDLVASGAVGTETLDLSIGGTTYSIDYDNTTTLQDLSDAINEKAGSKVSASILQTGDAAYSLILSSKETGSDQTISTATSGSLDAKLLSSGTLFEAQAAQDAQFKYNGIDLTRSTNEITDITFGLSINLLQETGSANIKITQNPEPIKTELESFVTSYNSLISQIKSLTGKDQVTGVEGVFNGDNTINSIARDISRSVLAVNNEGTSLVEYGIDIDRTGTMSLDKSTFDAKISNDPQGVQDFFSGKNVTDSSGDINFQQGAFADIYDTINSYTKFNGFLDNIQAGVKTEIDNLSDRHARTLATLNDRYDILTKRFAAFDLVINKLNSQFASLQQQINAKSTSN